MAINMPRLWYNLVSKELEEYPDTGGAQSFRVLLAAGHNWSVKRPRALKRWADRHEIGVFDQERFMTIVNVGWDGPQKWAALKAAVKELRQARVAVAAGLKSRLTYAGDDRGLLALSDGLPQRYGRPHDPMGGDGPDQASSAWPGWPAAKPELPAEVAIGASAQAASDPDNADSEGSTATGAEPNGEPSGPAAPSPPTRPLPGLPPSLAPLPLPGLPGWGPGPSSSPMPSAPNSTPPSSTPRPMSTRPGGGFAGGGNFGGGGGGYGPGRR